MSTLVPVYRKLRGGGFSWKGHGKIWLAEDHLLEVTSTLVLEDYRRFFFGDIRAFAMRRTNTRAIWGWIFGSLTVVLASISGGALWIGLANASKDWHLAMYFPAAFFGLGAIFFLLLLVINLSLGPSCRCHVLTATGWQALSAPTRVGRADRVQAQMASVIQAAQGPAPAAATATS